MKYIFIITSIFLMVIVFISCDPEVIPPTPMESEIFCHKDKLPPNADEKQDTNFYLTALKNGKHWTTNLYCLRKQKYHEFYDALDITIIDHDSCQSLLWIFSRNFANTVKDDKDSLVLWELYGDGFKSTQKEPICDLYGDVWLDEGSKNYFTLESNYSDSILTGKFYLELFCNKDTIRFSNGRFRLKTNDWCY